MTRAIIIEDELHSRELLKEMLQTYCKQIDLKGTAASVSEGIQLIAEVQPELVFLDIHIAEGDGFDILDAMQDQSAFRVIFVTGYEKYAIRAIKYAAFDYLLKPIILMELKEAVEKVVALPALVPSQVNLLKDKLEETDPNIDQIVLRDYKMHSIVNLKDIQYIEAKRSYTVFHLNNNQSRLASHPLNYFEDLLPDNRFFRIHKSYIINGHQVEQMDTGRGGEVTLMGGVHLPIATRRKSAFLRFINAIA